MFVIGFESLRPRFPMSIVFYFFLGFVTSFLGSIFPSMLSMTTVKISLRDSQKKAISFAAGVSIVVVIQAYIAIGFSKYLLDNPSYLMSIQQVGTIVFAGLSIYFFNQVIRSKKPQKKQKNKKVKGFVSGVLFSSLNMFAIPFYFAVTSTLVMMQWYEFNPSHNLLFVLGSSMGTFALLFLYAKMAQTIERKIRGLSRLMDVILGTLTALIVVVNLIDFLT